MRGRPSIVALTATALGACYRPATELPGEQSTPSIIVEPPVVVDSTPPESNTAAVLEQLAARSEGNLGRLVHPERGVFVIHNAAGSTPHLDHVHRWPHGRHDYSAYIYDPEILGDLSRASQWPARPPGPEPECYYLAPALLDPPSPPFGDYVIILIGDIECDANGDCDTVERKSLAEAGYDELAQAEPGFPEYAWTYALEVEERVAVEVRIGQSRLYFGELDGQWWLLVANLIDDGCDGPEFLAGSCRWICDEYHYTCGVTGPDCAQKCAELTEAQARQLFGCTQMREDCEEARACVAGLKTAR